MGKPRLISIALLAWTAGYVDALGYVILGGIFTSHVTGNTCALAVALVVPHSAGEVFRRGLMIAAFALGGALGTIVLERTRRGTVAALGLVAALLLLSSAGLQQFASGGRGLLTNALIGCLAAAMGVQNIALADGAGRRGHTTHITGPYTDLVAQATHRLIRSARAQDRTPTAVYAARVGGFVTGAISGAAASLAVGPAAPLVPSAVVAMAALLLRGETAHAG